MDRVI